MRRIPTGRKVATRRITGSTTTEDPKRESNVAMAVLFSLFLAPRMDKIAQAASSPRVFFNLQQEEGSMAEKEGAGWAVSPLRRGGLRERGDGWGFTMGGSVGNGYSEHGDARICRGHSTREGLGRGRRGYLRVELARVLAARAG
jgi:hypothetical protein